MRLEPHTLALSAAWPSPTRDMRKTRARSHNTRPAGTSGQKQLFGQNNTSRRGFLHASCVLARALSPPPSWRKMANHLRFCGTFSVGVMRLFCLPLCLRTCHDTFEHACSNMFEHGYRGIHAQYNRYPYGPYGVCKARSLECCGGLESREAGHF